jgi:hypothetical protein
MDVYVGVVVDLDVLLLLKKKHDDDDDGQRSV